MDQLHQVVAHYDDRLEKKDIVREITLKERLPQVLHRLVDGDDTAFDQLFLALYPAVKNFLVALLRSDYAGEEIAQEVFTTLWITRDRINPDGNFKGYLFQIAKNKALNYIRQNDPYRTEPISEELDVKSAESTDDAMLVDEMELLIDMAVSRMPPQRQKIYRMSRKEGVSNSEIALELNITKNAVERHLTFAMKDIRKVLKVLTLFPFA